jgi:hypothetical protein
VQEAGLCGRRRAHDLLEVSTGVTGDFLFGKPVAGSCDEHGHVNDQPAELLERGSEPGETGVAWPDVGREVLGEIEWVELLRRRGARQRRVYVEGAVGVEGALEGVYLAVAEGLLAEGPPGEVLGFFIFKFILRRYVVVSR